MATDTDRYIQRLTWELRRRGAPGDVVGDAIAQVESHLADEGSSPHTAFGHPAHYAASLMSAVHGQHRWAAYGLHLLAGAVLAAVCATAGVHVARSGGGTAQFDSLSALLVALVLFLGYGIGLFVSMRHRLRDPRKGFKK